jgi:hypothetical protein
MNRAALLLLLIGPIVGGCTASPLGPHGEGGGIGKPITTDAQAYVLRSQGSALTADIAIRFENRAASAMYIVNCNGGLAPVLEKRVGDAWVPYWAPILSLCLSSPIVIAPGASIERVLSVWGALPGTNQAPQWASAEMAGTYRIVLQNVVHNYDDRRQDFGAPVPLELRVSNEFTLTR